MKQANNRPIIGVGVIVVKKGKILLGKRKGSHGKGLWSFPGGHLEKNEFIEACAKREVFEETGIRIKNLRLGTFTNDIFKKERKHYVTLFIVADWFSGEAKLKEPDKCEQWDWFRWERLPKPLFLPVQNLKRKRFNPYKI